MEAPTPCGHTAMTAEDTSPATGETVSGEQRTNSDESEGITAPATHLEVLAPAHEADVRIQPKDGQVRVRIESRQVNQVVFLDEGDARRIADAMTAAAEQIEAESEAE